MSRTGILLATILVATICAGPAQAQSSTYVHVAAQPDFQYRSDQPVTVPFQAMLVSGGVPQQDAVQITVRHNGNPFPVSASDNLAAGVRPYPAVNHLGFGKLDPALYELDVTARAGGVQKTVTIAFSVVHAPVPYHADLFQAESGAARFDFVSDDAEGRNFTIRVYRDSTVGRLILEEVTTNATASLHVPYIIGESTRVEVQGPNNWLNHANRKVDPLSGRTTYNAWVWNPDYRDIENYQDTSLFNRLLLLGAVAAVAVFAVLDYRRRRRDQHGGSRGF